MENSPLIPEKDEDSSKDGEKSAKDKKKSRLGLYVVKNETPDEKKSEQSWFDKFKEESTEKDQAEHKKPELEVVPDAEIPLEMPSETEAAEVVRPKLIEVIESNEAELTPDPVTDPPIEKFRELVKSGEDPDEAFSEVMEELGVETSEIMEYENDEIVDERNVDFEEISLHPSSEAEQPIEIEEESNDTATASSQTSTSNRPSYIPPTPPVIHPPFGGQPPSGQNYNLRPPVPGAPTETESRAPESNQASPAAMALMGGIIGYLIGKRRGRIKTEKKLIPIQKKLEKQVENMQFDLQEKEKKIRRIALAKGEKTADVPFKQRDKAPEAVSLHAPKPKPERIGHMLVSAESNNQKIIKNIETKPQNKEFASSEKPVSSGEAQKSDRNIETLNRTELLALSEKIIIDGSSLRQIYETHLIGERGLRRLVAEQMHGGDLKKALQMEIVEREIDFERDPAVRDISPQQHRSAESGRVKSEALDKMVEKASASIGGDEQAAFIRARANYEAQQTRKQQQQRKLIDFSFIAVIVILIVAIIVLIITRM